ncbi:phosphoglycerate mutase family protein [Microbacteriaceae bacterium 4G12]
MELIFLRHGEGEHNTNEPGSFQILHPKLTEVGIAQVHALRKQFDVQHDEMIIASPTYRTLETAHIFSQANLYYSYVVSPRIYPYREKANTLPCDVVLTPTEIATFYPQFQAFCEGHMKGIDLFAINTLPPQVFVKYIEEFVAYCKGLAKKRIFIVSHDGTIMFFKEYLLQQTFTRAHMLGTAEYVILQV